MKQDQGDDHDEDQDHHRRGGAGEGGEQPMSSTMKVYIIIPDNDRQKSVSRITVRTTLVPGAYLAGPQRDCAMMPADLSLKAAPHIARWHEYPKDSRDM